jgi:signal transduction histidine kinase
VATDLRPRPLVPALPRPTAGRPRLLAALPRGHTLPAGEWRRRHHALLGLLWVHVGLLPVFSGLQGDGPLHALAEGALPAVFALLATLLHGEARRGTAAAAVALGLLTCSAVVVHVSGGLIEAHFHFFVVVVALTLYEEWQTFLLAAGFVAVHHGLAGAVAPEAVFSHPAAQADPWTWAAVHAGFIGAAGGVAVVAWRFNEDVRERHRATERVLGASSAELERSNRELEQFAHVASHDLVEPLHTISGFLELLERTQGDRLDERGREYVRHAIEGSARLQHMVDDVLASSRSSRGEVPREPVDLSVVVADARAGLARALAERDTRVDVGPLPTVRGDAGQLRQLLQNLLANAVKFTPADRAPRVSVGAERDGAGWTFAVVDDGAGIDPAQARRVFTMYGRGGDADGGAPGSGIGLAVCERIVRRHGGRIWIEPAPGRGTAVRFTLPAEAGGSS